MKKNVGKLMGWMREQKSLIREFREQLADIREEREKRKQPLVAVSAKKEKQPATRAKVDISVASVVKASIAVCLVVLALYVLFMIKDIVILVLVSFFLAAMLNPFVDFLQRHRIPRGLGVVISYILILALVIFSLIALFPVLKNQGDKLVTSISGYLQHIATNGFEGLTIPFVSQETQQAIVTGLNDLKANINMGEAISQLRVWLVENQGAVGQNLEGVAKNFFGVVSNVANGFGNVVIVLLLTFFIIVEKEEVKGFILAVIPPKYRTYTNDKFRNIQLKIGAWIRGQLILGLSIGLTTYVGFLILMLFGLDIEEKGILALIAGLTEVIPVVGPLIAGIISALVAANLGVLPFLVVVGMFIIIQQLENNILVPVVMRHAVGLSSFVIIIGMLIGVQFLGFLGLILAVPVTTIIGLFVQDFLNHGHPALEEEKQS